MGKKSFTAPTSPAEAAATSAAHGGGGRGGGGGGGDEPPPSGPSGAPPPDEPPAAPPNADTRRSGRSGGGGGGGGGGPGGPGDEDDGDDEGEDDEGEYEEDEDGYYTWIPSRRRRRANESGSDESMKAFVEAMKQFAEAQNNAFRAMTDGRVNSEFQSSKDLGKMALQHIPHKADKLEGWFDHSKMQLASATGRGSEACEWIDAVKRSTFNELAILNTGPWSKADWAFTTKMQALIPKAPKELQHRIIDVSKYMKTHNEFLSARQIMWQVKEFYKPNEETAPYKYNIEHLKAVTFNGDGKDYAGLKDFKHRWNQTFMMLPPEETAKTGMVFEIFTGKLMASDLMKSFVIQSRARPPFHEERTYGYLNNLIYQVIDSTREDKNVKDLSEGLMRVATGKQAIAAPAPTDAEANGNGSDDDGANAVPAVSTKNMTPQEKKAIWCTWFTSKTQTCKKGDSCPFGHPKKFENTGAIQKGKGKGKSKKGGKGKKGKKSSSQSSSRTSTRSSQSSTKHKSSKDKKKDSKKSKDKKDKKDKKEKKSKRDAAPAEPIKFCFKSTTGECDGCNYSHKPLDKWPKEAKQARDAWFKKRKATAAPAEEKEGDEAAPAPKQAARSKKRKKDKKSSSSTTSKSTGKSSSGDTDSDGQEGHRRKSRR